MEITYNTQGTCSKQIHFNLENGIIKSVEFVGGCNGNLQGISRLVEGMEADKAIERLSGIKCGFKQTSGPDQLARALKKAIEEQA